jgi:proteasome lid subunit RPN8/RPN11
MRQKTIEAIQAHAAADYPREACGLIAKRGEWSAISPAEIWPASRMIILYWRRRITQR